MKLICTQENLNKGLNLVSYLADKNTNLPILNNVLLKATKNGLTLITTNLEIGIKVFIRSKVEEEGEFTVDAKLLNNFISLLPKENIEIITKDKVLNIKNKNQEANISGLDAEDFPLIPEIEKENEVEIKIKDLKKALNQVIFSASSDNSRIEINAVNFLFKSNQLILVATDSYRLTEKKIKINSNKEKNLIIPLKTVQELVRILDEEDNQKINIYFNENQIMFIFNNIELVSRVINSKYPDYKQIIPKEFITTMRCEVNKLIPIIKSVSLFCKQGINDINLIFDSKNQKLEVSTTSSINGSKDIAKIPVKITGENNDIVFNFRYLLDGLNNINNKEIIININNSKSPGLLKPEDGQDYIYLIMPIKQ